MRMMCLFMLLSCLAVAEPITAPYLSTLSEVVRTASEAKEFDYSKGVKDVLASITRRKDTIYDPNESVVLILRLPANDTVTTGDRLDGFAQKSKEKQKALIVEFAQEALEGDEALAWDRTKILGLMLKTTLIIELPKETIDALVENAKKIGKKRTETTAKVGAVDLFLNHSLLELRKKNSDGFRSSIKLVKEVIQSSKDPRLMNYSVLKLLETGSSVSDRDLQIDLLKEVESIAKIKVH